MLTLRRLRVLIRHLPDNSHVAAVQRDGATHWSLEAFLLDDVRMAVTAAAGQKTDPHPRRPTKSRAKSASVTPERAKKLAAARSRAAARRKAIEDGRIT